MNKFKKRRFLETKNLLTGETEVHPDLIKVIFCHPLDILGYLKKRIYLDVLKIKCGNSSVNNNINLSCGKRKSELNLYFLLHFDKEKE